MGGTSASTQSLDAPSVLDYAHRRMSFAWHALAALVDVPDERQQFAVSKRAFQVPGILPALLVAIAPVMLPPSANPRRWNCGTL